MLVWIGSLTITTIIVFQKIKRYHQDVINLDTYDTYCFSIVIMLVFAIFLFLIWGVLAYSNCKWRESFERNTFIYAIGFILICAVGAVLIYCMYPGVERKSGSMIKLEYVFCYPCVFGFAIFGAAPSNVCKVMIPYRNEVRWILSGVFFLMISLVMLLAEGWRLV